MAAVVSDKAMSEQVADAKARLEDAREFLKLAHSAGEESDVKDAEKAVVLAMRAYRVLVPSAREPGPAEQAVAAEVAAETPAAPAAKRGRKKKAVAEVPTIVEAAKVKAPDLGQQLRVKLEELRAEEASKAPTDPSRLSGTEIRRKAAAVVEAAQPSAPEAQAKAMRAERAEVAAAAAEDPRVADYLEPEMQRLLADQVLRGESLKWTRQLIQWLAMASGHCASQQPALADKCIREVMRELQIQERVLKEAEVKAPRTAPRKASVRVTVTKGRK